VRKTIFGLMMLFAFVVSDGLSMAIADDVIVRRPRAKERYVCHGLKCGLYTLCRARCRIVCPDRYSCYPLYGAYGPYGGVGYWGSYTFTGWPY
jgi:hypothetical protein